MGSITVASGHVEAAMKRLILTLQDHRTRQFSLVDKTWTDLHKVLAKECQKGDEDTSRAELRRNLKAHLEWRDSQTEDPPRQFRFHGSIWDYAMPLVLVSRFHRKADGQQIMLTMEQIEQVSIELAEYADRLEALLYGIWHEAMLPGGAPGSWVFGIYQVMVHRAAVGCASLLRTRRGGTDQRVPGEQILGPRSCAKAASLGCNLT